MIKTANKELAEGTKRKQLSSDTLPRVFHTLAPPEDLNLGCKAISIHDMHHDDEPVDKELCSWAPFLAGQTIVSPRTAIPAVLDGDLHKELLSFLRDALQHLLHGSRLVAHKLPLLRALGIVF